MLYSGNYQFKKKKMRMLLYLILPRLHIAFHCLFYNSALKRTSRIFCEISLN